MLETERFLIRQWELADVEQLYEIMSDSKVQTYTSSGIWTKQKTENYVKFHADKGFQTLEQFHAACIMKDSNNLIGLAGLNPYLPKQPEFELKFGVSFWGKGYATEIGIKIISETFSMTDVSAIYGIVMPENQASLRVLEKLGMICLGMNEYRERQYMFYRIDRV